MKPQIPLLLALSCFPLRAHGAITLAQGGHASHVIVVEPGSTPAEQYAAKELAETLGEITGASFAVQTLESKAPRAAILIGQGPLVRRLFPEVPFEELGQEEVVLKTKGNRLLLAGGRPRGTLYAVAQFLRDQCGVRWWTPWASRIPKQPRLQVGKLDLRYRPPFESRDPFWFPAFDAKWAARNFSNSQSARLPEEMGGAIIYRGFVHTFYPLVPPEQHFAAHPEWFSLVKGQRVSSNGQLCLTQPALRDFVVQQVKQWLRETPTARILSVSQNDWYGACECPACKALDDAEGSHAGTLLDFVNYVAERIEAEFPQVAIDTLAYQYTRKPPKTIKPRPNVIVRLCSIECNFREPLDSPANVAFAADIQGWAKVCNRLYIWDYTTDFAHYVQPHPNWFVLGPNVRFFARHNVRGLFEQGAYQSYGSEFAELRAWVLAQLLWNPSLDDRALINEFLEGYYGPAAATHIRAYMDLMHQASAGYNLTCFSKTDTPFLKFNTLAQAEKLWEAAEQAVAGDPALLPRIRQARLPLRYAWLCLWTKLRKECLDAGAAWPLAASRKAVAEEWLALARGSPDLPWTKIALINESGLTPEKFVERFAQDPPEPAADKPTQSGTQTPGSPAASVQPLPRIRVVAENQALVQEDGRRFLPFGVNYFRPHSGWAPQLWKQFDPEATRKDFARMKELGVNCVRVFLSYGSFMMEPGVLRDEGVAKFDHFLSLAEEAGIYVHPTGPDHWEGLPPWAGGDRYADERVLSALEGFWKQFASRYRGRKVLFAYDLLNEPEVRWDTPAMRERWNRWLERRYGSAEKLTTAWGVTPPLQLGQIPVPTPKDAPGNRELLDYQRLREDVADEWTRRQVAAIKAADPEALVTVGLIQWSVPALLAGAQHYSAFRPERQAKFLDFMEVHFYPLSQGFYAYANDQDEARNLAYLESVVREVARAGKPVVIAECGWYGGGQLTIDQGRHPPATQEQQARWGRRLVETTAGLACGWLNWGLYDHPEARDVTQLTGLLTVHGETKAWGREFQRLAALYTSQPLPTPKKVERPSLDWDRCITSPQAANQFRELYFQAFAR